MKITKEALKRIIAEELSGLEEVNPVYPSYDPGASSPPDRPEREPIDDEQDPMKIIKEIKDVITKTLERLRSANMFALASPLQSLVNPIGQNGLLAILQSQIQDLQNKNHEN